MLTYDEIDLDYDPPTIWEIVDDYSTQSIER